MPSKREERKARRVEKLPDTRENFGKPSNFYVSDHYKFERSALTPEQVDAEKEKARKEKAWKANQFEAYCKWAAKAFPKLAEDETVTPEYVDALNFLGWKMTPGELNAGSRLAYTFGAMLAALIVLYGFYSIVLEGQDIIYFGIYVVFGVFAFYAGPLIVKSYPLSAAQDQKNKILIEIPKIIGYMNMSMKLTPNLERSVEFASQHGQGKLANALGDLLWGTRTGIYGSMEEGLDELAYTWGKYSIEFKQALMTVRSSVLEPDDARRHALLDSALSEALKSVGNKMSDQAAALKAPAMYMFYLGVLLPLVLIIVLPIGSVFAKNPVLSNPFVLVALYNVGIPLMMLVYANMILAARPPIYSPPDIPDSHPELPPKGMFRMGSANVSVTLGAIAILAAGAAASWFAYAALDPNVDVIVQEEYGARDFAAFEASRSAEDVKDFYRTHDLQPFYGIGAAIMTLCLALSFHLYFSSAYKRKVQEDVMQMEEEFKDSAYLIASRLGQNKPIEDAVKYVGEFLPDSKLSQVVFTKVRQNIALLGMTFEGAVFDPTYGALKNIPSELINTSMKIITDSVQLGVNVAARALMSLSQQLQSFDAINRQIRTELAEVTSTMQSMAGFIAPLVLGITTALQKIILDTIGSVTAGASNVQLPEGVSFGGIDTSSVSGLTGAGGASALESSADPTQFLLILIVYVVEVVILLTYFGANIKEGKNKLTYKIAIAQTLPVAMVLFLAAAWFAKNLLLFSG